VFTDPAGLNTDTVARMTREMNCSECTFVFPSEPTDTDVRLRIFGLGGEMPFAGHPVIGSTFALAYEHIIKAGQPRLVFGLGLGPTPVDLEWKGSELAFAWMTHQGVRRSALHEPPALHRGTSINLPAPRSSIGHIPSSCGVIHARPATHG
jgi:PhzF family phenazine biosynthesis protein